MHLPHVLTPDQPGATLEAIFVIVLLAAVAIINRVRRLRHGPIEPSPM
jgi:hypothetical protein